ncbi:MAG: hypothetical protein IJ094_05505 [Bacilli bacterium]|nr:hypothetical protein [Bacilli bacterium]
MNKQSNLITDITKNIISQYISQLEKSIRENKADKTLDKYEYECRVERAERALEYVKQIYSNYDISLEKYKNKLLWKKGVSEETKQIESATSFSNDVFNSIGINNNDAIRKALYHVIVKETNNEESKEEVYGIDNQNDYISKYYKKDGIYESGKLKINNLLGSHVTFDTNEYVALESRPVYYDQIRDFYIDANQIDEISKKYLESLATERKLNNDDFINLCKTIESISGGGITLSSGFNTFMFNFVLDHDFNGLKNILEKDNYFLEKYSKQDGIPVTLPEEDVIGNMINELKEKTKRLESLVKEEKELEDKLFFIRKEKEELSNELLGRKL